MGSRIYLSLSSGFLALVLSPLGSAHDRGLGFEHLSIEDGLSQSTVTTILQDRDGFLWFGTHDGLNLYDGYSFRVYRRDPDDVSTLSDNWISALAEDSEGRLWVGTYGPGLCRLDSNRRGFTRFDLGENQRSGLFQNLVKVILEVKPGTLWLSTELQGILVLETATGRISVLTSQDPVFNPAELKIVDMLRDDRGDVWTATENSGVFHIDMDTGKATRWSDASGDRTALTSNRTTALAMNADGAVWVGTDRMGLNLIYPESGTVTRYKPEGNPAGPPRTRINDLMIDDEGHLWAATTDFGVQVYDHEGFTTHTRNLLDPSGLRDRHILSLLHDRSGNYWVGTYARGLNKAIRTRKGFRHYRYRADRGDSLSQGLVSSFAFDSAGQLWVGVRGEGISVLIGNDSFRRLQHDPEEPDSLSDNLVYHMLTDRNGVVWVATGNGLNRRHADEGTFTRYFHDPEDAGSLTADFVQFLFEDSRERFWVGTQGGLGLMDRETGRFRHYRHDPEQPASISSNQINSVVEDIAGQIWVGTDLGFNLMYEDGTFRSFVHDPREPEGLQHNSVMCIYPDGNGVLWIGTFGGGMARYDKAGNRFRHFTEKDNLPNNSVYGIVDDDLGYLWISTNGGLSRFDPKNETFHNFDIGSGLLHSEFNRNAFYKDKSGNLLFGTLGVVQIDPSQAGQGGFVPPVVLTSVRKYNEEILLDIPLTQLKELKLNRNDHMISFSVAALDYSKPERNRFSYMLEGFNENWIELSRGIHNISFTNLDPGNYTLRIKGANADSVWNEEGIELDIRMPYPWWQTAPAFLLYFAGLAAVVFVSRYMRRHLKERSMMRAISLGKAEFATTILHNIGNILNSLRISCDQGERTLRGTKLKQILRAMEMLKKNQDQPDYLTEDPRGKLLPEYLLTAGSILSEEQQEVLTEFEEMSEKINLMKDIIETQQAHAKLSLMDEGQELNLIVENALKVQDEALERRHITLKTILGDVSLIKVQKTQLMHIIINLLKNAAEAMETVMDRDRVLTVETRQNGKTVQLVIRDTGVGIAAEHLKKMFSYGFTTKESGHGFGLHFCWRAMKEMGGTITVESEGRDMGAEFVMTFPASR
ncbi:MAG: two-component regulator propeller domain-containing protein [Acidobacteriota bacterium]|nr:two-component regulator propeller domain-containing protein [Acidobacteriota bacterium]